MRERERKKKSERGALEERGKEKRKRGGDIEKILRGRRERKR